MTVHPCALRFCSLCGFTLTRRQVAHDNLPRMVCNQCREVAYQNPKILVTTVVESAGRVLLCRRAEEPRLGYWTLPGGFMECGESLQQAAARETLEETGIALPIEELALYGVFSLPHIDQVYVAFRAQVAATAAPLCGPECQDARFFSRRDAPWQHLAFPAITAYLQRFFAEGRQQRYDVHLDNLTGRNFSLAV